MKKHFERAITDTSFRFARKGAEIAAEAAMAGLDVVRTNLPEAPLDDAATVRGFRSLLADLATVVRNTILPAITPLYPLTVVTRPTPLQQKAFDLLGLAV